MEGVVVVGCCCWSVVGDGRSPKIACLAGDDWCMTTNMINVTAALVSIRGCGIFGRFVYSVLADSRRRFERGGRWHY